MADAPWQGRKLSVGQIVQLLESKGCTELRRPTPTLAQWVAPTGQPFTISYADIDAEFLENMVAQIERWVNERRER